MYKSTKSYMLFSMSNVVYGESAEGELLIDK